MSPALAGRFLSTVSSGKSPLVALNGHFSYDEWSWASFPNFWASFISSSMHSLYLLLTFPHPKGLLVFSSWVKGTLYILAVCNIGCKIPDPPPPSLSIIFFVLLCLCFFWPWCLTCGISVLWPAIQLGPWQWKRWALTTQLPGCPLLWLYIFIWLCLVAACKPLVVTCGISFPDQGSNLGPPALGGLS